MFSIRQKSKFFYVLERIKVFVTQRHLLFNLFLLSMSTSSLVPPPPRLSPRLREIQVVVVFCGIIRLRAVLISFFGNTEKRARKIGNGTRRSAEGATQPASGKACRLERTIPDFSYTLTSLEENNDCLQSLPRPQASLLIIWWCLWRCGIGALRPSHDAQRSLFAALYRRLGTRPSVLQSRKLLVESYNTYIC